MGWEADPTEFQDGIGYSSNPFDLTGYLALAAMIAAGMIVIGTLIVLTTWWMAADETLRSILEASPLSGSIAERAQDAGQPGKVAAVVAGLVAAVVIGISFWRRRIAIRCAYGRLHRSAFLGVSLLRTIALFGGISLVPVAAGIASGSDLEEEAGAITELWPVAIVAMGIAGYTLVSAGRRWERFMADPPPPPGDLDPAASGSAR